VPRQNYEPQLNQSVKRHFLGGFGPDSRRIIHPAGLSGRSALTRDRILARDSSPLGQTLAELCRSKRAILGSGEDCGHFGSFERAGHRPADGRAKIWQSEASAVTRARSGKTWLITSPELWRTLLPGRDTDIHLARFYVAETPSFERIEIRKRKAIDWFNQTFICQAVQVAPQQNFVPRTRESAISIVIGSRSDEVFQNSKHMRASINAGSEWVVEYTYLTNC
jgi:hypothetical protein